MSGQANPDDTSRCPVAVRCELCATSDHLTVWTATTPVGVTCVTLCAGCDDAMAPLPRFTVGEAVRRVMAHAGHLGCTVDDLAGADR